MVAAIDDSPLQPKTGTAMALPVNGRQKAAASAATAALGDTGLGPYACDHVSDGKHEENQDMAGVND